MSMTFKAIGATMLAVAATASHAITLPDGYAAYGAVYDCHPNVIAAIGGPQGWLATIYTAQENGAIVDGYVSRGLDLWGYRIGATRSDVRVDNAVIPGYSGPWYWNFNSSEPMGYSNWAAGQPDNLWGDQNLARFDHDGKWDDTSDNGGWDRINGIHYHLGFVAEFAGHLTSAVPEPGSWALMLAGIAGLAGFHRRGHPRR